MPARAQGLRPALRAGFRKPSGEEAAVSARSVSVYGDSGCRCGAEGADRVAAVATGAIKRPTCRPRGRMKRQGRRWPDGDWGVAGRRAQPALRHGQSAMAGMAAAEVVAALMSCHTTAARAAGRARRRRGR